MPWNFPFWQAIRFAVPTILAGNVIVLKHASICEKSGETMQEIFEEAGLPKGLLSVLVGRGSVIGDAIAQQVAHGHAGSLYTFACRGRSAAAAPALPRSPRRYRARHKVGSVQLSAISPRNRSRPASAHARERDPGINWANLAGRQKLPGGA